MTTTLETQNLAELPAIKEQSPGLMPAPAELHNRKEVVPEGWAFVDEHGIKYRLLVAATRSERERAYRLAYQVYATRGYVPDADGRIVSDFDAEPNTLTLLVEDEQGRDAATLSLVIDSDAGLPSDEIYSDELNALRHNGYRMGEVTRLAIDEAHARSREILINIFELTSVYARRLVQITDMVIEVNPRHVAYYRRLLAFEPAGPEKPCPRVQGAPAVLLRLDLSVQEKEIRRIGGTRTNEHGRSLYAYYCPLPDEPPIAHFLTQRHRPMSLEDARYFGLTHPVTSRCLVMAY